MPAEIVNSARDELLKDSKTHCALWRARRLDGKKFYWTNHDREYQFPPIIGPFYQPSGCLDAGDVSTPSGDTPQNLEVHGAIRTEDVTSEDIDAGRWKLCQITEYIVNHKDPLVGIIMESKYFIQDIDTSDEQWTAQLEGMEHFLANLIGLKTVVGCQNVFGAAFGLGAAVIGCRFDVEGDALTIRDVQIENRISDRIFELNTTAVPAQADGAYDNGTIEFLSGRNEGIKIRIDRFTNANRRIELVREAPYAIKDSADPQGGDLVAIRRGCANTWSDCEVRTQTNNYRGFRFVPSEEDLAPAPRSRE